MFELRYGKFSITVVGWVGIVAALILVLAMFAWGR